MSAPTFSLASIAPRLAAARDGWLAEQISSGPSAGG